MLLGRATILIKGIAKRLDINWDLARKWRPMAEQALNCGVDGCLMPTWSAAPSTAPKAEALVDGPVRFYVEGSRAAHTSATRPPARPPPPAPDQARGLQPRPASANLAQMSWLAGHTGPAGPVFQIGALPGGAEQATVLKYGRPSGRACARTSHEGLSCMRERRGRGVAGVDSMHVVWVPVPLRVTVSGRGSLVFPFLTPH